MQEIWKDVKDYEGLYQVSNLGRVKSLDKEVRCFDRTRIIKGRMLKQDTLFNYLRVSLMKNHKYTHKRVHRLVLETFNPIDNMNNLVVNHKDYNTKNNRLDNLEWCSIKENIAYSNDRRIPIVQKNMCKPVCQYDLSGKLLKEFFGIKEAERQTNVKQSSISRCCYQKQKTAGGYIWKFKEMINNA